MTGRLTAESGRYSDRVAEVTTPRYRASFTVYVERAEGGAYTVPVSCMHAHEARAAARLCAARLAAYVERHEAVPAWAEEVWTGALADALARLAGPA